MTASRRSEPGGTPPFRGRRSPSPLPSAPAGGPAVQSLAHHTIVMTYQEDAEGLPFPSSALLQLARLKAGMSQRELAERAGIPVTMIHPYPRFLPSARESRSRLKLCWRASTNLHGSLPCASGAAFCNLSCSCVGTECPQG
jgi:hypothetical protein